LSHAKLIILLHPFIHSVTAVMHWKIRMLHSRISLRRNGLTQPGSNRLTPSSAFLLNLYTPKTDISISRIYWYLLTEKTAFQQWYQSNSVEIKELWSVEIQLEGFIQLFYHKSSWMFQWLKDVSAQAWSIQTPLASITPLTSLFWHQITALGFHTLL
jgi:hypothetical protein